MNRTRRSGLDSLRLIVRALLCLAAAQATGQAMAQAMAQAAEANLPNNLKTGAAVVNSNVNLLSLNAQASIEVTQDVLSITYSVRKEGADAQSVQTALRQALDAALVEAKKAAKPGQLEVQTGDFSLMPRYTPKGEASGWQGSAELTTFGKDMAGVAKLVGRIQSMTVARVAHDLSREAREKVDSEAIAQAVGKFRARASEVVKQFGYSDYQIREVNVSTNEPNLEGGPRPRVAMRSMSADAALPTEAGKASVSAMVNGVVEMRR